jgi:polyhydroxyalkanoate synthesis regulator phasin
MDENKNRMAYPESNAMRTAFNQKRRRIAVHRTEVYGDRDILPRDVISRNGNIASLAKAHTDFRLAIQETMPGGVTIDRRMIGAGGSAVPRTIAKHIEAMYQAMRDKGWLGTQEDGKFNAGEASAAYEKDPEAFSEQVAKRMTPDIWREFVQEITKGMEGRAALYGPKQADGIERVAGGANVAKAFDAAQGDLVKLAENLYALEADGKNVIESPADFVGKTLAGFQGFFDSLHNQFKDMDAAKQKGVPLPPRFLMDARVSESYPGAWLEYMTYGHQNMQVMASRMAAEAAYGRNYDGMVRDLENGIENLKDKSDKFDHIVETVRTNNLFASGKGLDAAIKSACESDAVAKEKGWSYRALQQAREDLRLARNCQRDWQNLKKIDGGVALELRP